MSFNQSRSDKNETQYRKTGRSASSNQQHRGYSPSYPKGTGAGGPGPSISSNRSFRKNNNNAQGGQSRPSVTTVNTQDSGIAFAQRGVVQNGAHVQPQLHGGSDAPVASTASRTAEASASQRTSRTVPKAPTSQSASATSDTRTPTTPAKSPGDASKGFAFQFGSISPGFMNGMQIPARTSSAPPNLDEQKRDQARHDSFRAVPSVPVPTVPKQQLPRKDSVSIDQPNAAEVHMLPKVKKDVQVSHAPPPSQTQKPSPHPMAGMSMPMPFHQPQVPLQFGGPNQQIQSQSMSASAIPMPMTMQLPIGSTQVQQPVFVQGLQPHPIQSQGIMHQGQNMTFSHQMGPQIPQMGNLGISMASQYPQQQGRKFGGPRKTPVKITHPDTHEELRLDKRTDSYPDSGSAPRTHPNIPPQSQSIPSFAHPHTTTYYANSYNPSSLYYSASSSHPLTSSHMPPNSQAPRFSYQVSQGSQPVPFINSSSHSTLPVSKSGSLMHNVVDPPNLEHARDVHNISASVPSATIPVVIKPPAGTVGEKVVDPLPNSSTVVEKGELSKPVRQSGEIIQSAGDQSILKSLPVMEKVSANAPATASVEKQVSNLLSSSSAAPTEESAPVVIITEPRKKETLSRSNSIKDQQKKPGKKGNVQPQLQVVGQSSSTSSALSQSAEYGIPSTSDVSGTVEANTTLAPVSSASVSKAAKEPPSDVSAPTADCLESKTEDIGQGNIPISSEISAPGMVVGNSDSVHHSQLDSSLQPDEQGQRDLMGAEKQAEQSLSGNYKQDTEGHGISAESISVKPLESAKVPAEHSVVKETAKGNTVAISDTAQGGQGHYECLHAESGGMDASLSRSDSMGGSEGFFSKSSKLEQHSASVQTTELSGRTSKTETEGTCEENIGGGGGNIENIGSGGDSLTVSDFRDKPELSRTKSTFSRGKKKRKEILSKADAAGMTSDLYVAYKNPEEKKGIENTESIMTSIISKQVAADAPQQDAVGREKDAPVKAEPEDWEDAADISPPKLETSDTGEQVCGVDDSDKDGHEHGAKKYSRDFLLKFTEQFTELPEGFEITTDIAEILDANVNAAPSIDYDSLPSPGRIVDRQGGAARLDRRGNGIMDDDRWNKGGAANFRTGQGPNFGVLRNPRAPTPVQQHVRGILPGPGHSVGHQGGMQRNNSDADRWQRATNFQPKGLMPSPHTPLQVMHQADRKNEVGKVSDEELAKQRKLKAILNKLTPQNFEKLFEQVKAVNIDNATTLTGVVSQIFDKAVMEPTFCEMYANFCFYLAGELPGFSEDNEKITFRRLLLCKCQEEFERGEREQEEAYKANEEGQVKQSEEEEEEKGIKARRRTLGNIRLIGELYKKKMLTERIMHKCIKKLLGQQQTPDEEDIEALCILMSTIGEMIDHPKAKKHMDAYFERMKSLSNNMKLSSRVRFMLKDAIDLRKNKWQQRRKVEGRIKIEEVHRDAAQERQAQSSRLVRDPGINPSARRGPPMEFSPRGSTKLSSPNAHMKLTPQNFEKLFEQRHQADRKNEVGKVSDEEQAKQRQLKAILNKLTPQNFEKLFEQVKAVNIDNVRTLTGVISQIFDKALLEPTLCEMYANFCFYLAGELPDFSEDNEKITFKRLLLNKCQEEFEGGEREQEEANKADEEGQVKQSEEEREEKRIKARRRMLGNIRLIGELYKKKMLTERIMHECIKKLLGQQQTPDEEDIEALCKLMSTIGEMIDHPKAKEHMDAYFERVKSLSNNMKLSSRVRFMLKDAIDLRKNKWQQRRKVEGPKKIEEVHRDAAQERQAQSSRLARGPGINPSARRGPPMEFSPRGSTISSPNAHMGGFRGMPAQVRGYGSQDVRTDERHSYESRTLSVPLTQRPIGDDSITLGPQGGLARGMSIRGPPSMSAAPLAEMPHAVDSRRMTAGLNGFSSLSERTTYNAREDPVPRYMPDRFSGPAAYDQSSVSERNLSFGGRDLRSSDHRTLPTSPPTRAHGATLTQNVHSENVLTDDHLRDMSLAAIKEFYSARDEKEVALCIKELNSPSFHPSIISLWVTDSFERKDTERHLLAKLLVKLTKTHDGTLSQPQLIKGFEAVLSTLEDAVNDAPRAPEFLGLIFAKVILENVISLNQIGQLIQEGGEEPGHLLKVGLAGNVLGSVLEIIKSEKGDSGLNEIRMSSNLRLETFRPPDPLKSRILEKFI